MALNKQRIENNLEAFKEYYTEERSKTGQITKNPKRHLFWVEHIDDLEAAGHPVLGHQVEGMINDDKYRFEYLGQNGSAEATAKLASKLEGQKAQIEAGLRRKQERTGFVPEPAKEPEPDPEPEKPAPKAKAPTKAKDPEPEKPAEPTPPEDPTTPAVN